jgi:hypothetical protein
MCRLMGFWQENSTLPFAIKAGRSRQGILEGMKDAQKAFHAKHDLIANVKYDHKPMNRIDNFTPLLKSKVQSR